MPSWRSFWMAYSVLQETTVKPPKLNGRLRQMKQIEKGRERREVRRIERWGGRENKSQTEMDREKKERERESV